MNSVETTEVVFINITSILYYFTNCPSKVYLNNYNFITKPSPYTLTSNLLCRGVIFMCTNFNHVYFMLQVSVPIYRLKLLLYIKVKVLEKKPFRYLIRPHK